MSQTIRKIVEIAPELRNAEIIRFPRAVDQTSIGANVAQASREAIDNLAVVKQGSIEIASSLNSISKANETMHSAAQRIVDSLAELRALLAELGDGISRAA